MGARWDGGYVTGVGNWFFALDELTLVVAVGVDRGFWAEFDWSDCSFIGVLVGVVF